MFLFKKIISFIFVALTSFFAISCSTFGFLQNNISSEESYSTWEQNVELRKKMEEKEVRYENNLELLGEPYYTSDAFEEIYSKQNSFAKPQDLIAKFDSLEDYSKLSHNTTYKVIDLYDQAATFANLILENDENILSWKVPSFSSEEYKWSYDSESNNQKAIVYLQGGPEGDVSEGGLRTSAYVYGKYGTMFYLNEAQFGFIPQDYVYENKKKYLSLDFPPYVKEAIQDEDLDEIQAFQVLMENTSFDLNIIEILLASSMALNKIEADKMALLGQKLKNDYGYNKIYFGGLSHGFTVGVDVIIQNEKNLEQYDAIVLENNMLMPAQQEGTRFSGGLVYENDEETFEGNRSYVNPLVKFARTIVKDVYGQKNQLETLLLDPNKATLLKQKVHFKIVLNDFNVGNPTEEELRFYYQNEDSLNFKIKYKGGHNALLSDEEYSQIFV